VNAPSQHSGRNALRREHVSGKPDDDTRRFGGRLRASSFDPQAVRQCDADADSTVEVSQQLTVSVRAVAERRDERNVRDSESFAGPEMNANRAVHGFGAVAKLSSRHPLND
jgi:hypothetical protein